jgi:dTDP-glucose 4,6-dehydratase
MKKILVTGGYGFIGSSFVLQQIASGNAVINLDKLTYAADLKNLAEVEKSPNYTFYKGDICDKDLVSEIINKHQIDYLVNFAAESHVDNSISSPGEFIQTNIIGTFNLLQCALEYFKNLNDERKKAFRFLHVSTDEVFGDLPFDDSKFDEETRYNPSSPYSSSKAASDHLVRAWGRTYGLPIIITNCSNNFGPRQNAEKLIPKVISNCLKEVDIPVYGKGENVRDWIYVDDHCAGIYLALTKGEVGGTYCLGGNAERQNIEIVNLICNHLDEIKPRKSGSYKDLIKYVTDRLGHDLRYAIDDKKARSELGFKQSKTFEERLHQTISWYVERL